MIIIIIYNELLIGWKSFLVEQMFYYDVFMTLYATLKTCT